MAPVVTERPTAAQVCKSSRPNVVGRWRGERAFVVATGASLTQADVDALRGRGRVIVVNKAYLLAPWADVLFSIDRQFWDQVVPDFAGERWTVEGCSSIEPHGLDWLESVKDQGLGAKRLHWIAGSGGTAINLAFLFGANPIVLLGFDMQRTNGRIHWHEDYPRGNPDEQRFRRWRRELAKTPETFDRHGVRVVNCTRHTALDCFERAELEAML